MLQVMRLPVRHTDRVCCHTGGGNCAKVFMRWFAAGKSCCNCSVSFLFSPAV